MLILICRPTDTTMCIYLCEAEIHGTPFPPDVPKWNFIVYPLYSGSHSYL